MNILFVFCAAFVFSLFDYIGYNLMAVKANRLVLYRILQTVIQILIAVLLYLFCGVLTAAGFIFLWWTWVDDWIYYIIDYLSQRILGISFEGGESLKEVFTGKTKVSWAWWTIVGLIKSPQDGKKAILSNRELIIQSIIGIFLTIILKLITG